MTSDFVLPFVVVVGYYLLVCGMLFLVGRLVLHAIFMERAPDPEKYLRPVVGAAILYPILAIAVSPLLFTSLVDLQDHPIVLVHVFAGWFFFVYLWVYRKVRRFHFRLSAANLMVAGLWFWFFSVGVLD